MRHCPFSQAKPQGTQYCRPGKYRNVRYHVTEKVRLYAGLDGCLGVFEENESDCGPQNNSQDAE